MQDHLRFGTGAGGMFIETLADFAAMEEDYERAAQLYAAAHAETLRAGMPWPRRVLGQELLTTTRNHLNRADYQRAWQEGERQTITEIARSGQGANESVTRRTVPTPTQGRIQRRD